MIIPVASTPVQSWGDEAPTGVRRGEGCSPPNWKRGLGGANFFCFVIWQWRILVHSEMLN